MADLILIPVVLLILYKIEYKKDGIYEDYLSIERSNILKAIMAFIVMLSHCTLSYLNINTFFLKFLSGGDAVKIFFFLSGFGLAYSCRKKAGYLNNFFSRRLSKLLVPVILVAILNVIFFKYAGTFYDTDGITVKNVFTSFFNNGYTIVFNLWYVVELIVLYIGFYFSFKLSKNDFNKGINYSVAFTVVVMLAFYLVFIYKGWLAVWFYSTYAFAFGLIWGAKDEEIKEFAKHKSNYMFSILLSAFAILMLIVVNLKSSLETGNYDIIKNLILGPVVILGIVIAGMKIKVNCKFWKVMGSISYEIYLVHGIFINLLRGNKIYIQNDFLYVLCVVVLSVLTAFILNYLSKMIIKPINKSKAR